MAFSDSKPKKIHKYFDTYPIPGEEYIVVVDIGDEVDFVGVAIVNDSVVVVVVEPLNYINLVIPKYKLCIMKIKKY